VLRPAEDVAVTGPAWSEDEFDVHMGFFADMDENSDGFITSGEMEAYARSVGMEVTQDRVRELIADKDFDKDGPLLLPSSFPAFWAPRVGWALARLLSCVAACFAVVLCVLQAACPSRIIYCPPAGRSPRKRSSSTAGCST
jgi:hypothetical protein